MRARHRLATFLSVLVVSGCGLRGDRDERFALALLSPRALEGYWVITDDSLRCLRPLGYQCYTNKMDHMFLLKPDGSCVYRGFDRYKRHEFWWKESEEDQHATFAGGRNSRLWPNGLPAARSWYVWRPNEMDPIQGPLLSTNNLTGVSGRLMANRWTEWRLQDAGQKGATVNNDLGTYTYRYRVQLVNPAFKKDQFLFVGCRGGVTYLWMPVYGRHAMSEADCDMVRFERWIPSRLKTD